MYSDMVKLARSTGYADEKKMEQSVEAVDELLEEIKDVHPEKYWKFMRTSHESLFGYHYDAMFAELDVERLKYTDKNGEKHTGAHWTREQVIQAYNGKDFPNGTTECDKWVAANVMYSDLCRGFDESQVLDAAYLFFFKDEDWPNKGKTWWYMKH